MKLLPSLLVIGALLSAAAHANKTVDFQLQDLAGQKHSLSEHRGKWVVVNFWASWCSPCIQELPELSAFQQGHPQQVQVIGINFEETTVEETQAFLKQLPQMHFPHLKYPVDGSGLPAEFFVDQDGNQLSLQGLPSTFFIDPEGRMLGMHLGPLDQHSLLQTLTQFGFRPR